jgi:hypothetical protein
MIKLMAVVAVCISLLAGSVIGVDTDLRLDLLKACGHSCIKAATSVEAAVDVVVSRIKVKSGGNSEFHGKSHTGGEGKDSSGDNQPQGDKDVKSGTDACEGEDSGFGLGTGVDLDLEIGTDFNEGPVEIEAGVGADLDRVIEADVDVDIDLGAGTGGLGCLLSCR